MKEAEQKQVCRNCKYRFAWGKWWCNKDNTMVECPAEFTCKDWKDWKAEEE